MEDHLEFTIETGEDFADKWLPMLDTRLRVTGSNQVSHGYYEKPTNSNVTIQMRSAMTQDSKIQVLSNDLVRRLKNNSEESNWFRKKKSKECYAKESTWSSGSKPSFVGSRPNKELDVKTILFLEQSPKGELATRLRETLYGMETTLGFRVKDVERNGRSPPTPNKNLYQGRKTCWSCAVPSSES